MSPLAAVHTLPRLLQETADGEIVVLHDFHLADAFPDRGPNTAPYRRLHAQLSSSSSSSPGGDSARPRGPLVKVCGAQLLHATAASADVDAAAAGVG